MSATLEHIPYPATDCQMTVVLQRGDSVWEAFVANNPNAQDVKAGVDRTLIDNGIGGEHATLAQRYEAARYMPVDSSVQIATECPPVPEQDIPHGKSMAAHHNPAVQEALDTPPPSPFTFSSPFGKPAVGTGSETPIARPMPAETAAPSGDALLATVAFTALCGIALLRHKRSINR